MNFSVVGVGPDGRSRVLETREDGKASVNLAPGIGVENLWQTTDYPPDLPVARRPIDASWMDLGVGPGTTRWILVTLSAGHTDRLHHTSTIDFDIVISGEVTLGLEDGELLMRAGDSVVIPGLLHKWTAGLEGCVMSSITYGLPSPT